MNSSGADHLSEDRKRNTSKTCCVGMNLYGRQKLLPHAYLCWDSFGKISEGVFEELQGHGVDTALSGGTSFRAAVL